MWKVFSIVIIFGGIIFPEVICGYILYNKVISGGGTETKSSSYTLNGTISQSTIGIIHNSNYRAHIGYWSPISNVGIEEDKQIKNIPKVFSLGQNYPNPMNLNTTIKYGIPKTTSVSFKIYNSAGQVIRTFLYKDQKPGFYKIYWDGKDNQQRKVALGAYFYRLETEDFKKCRKLILIK